MDGLWFSDFCQPAYDDIGRIARDYDVLTPKPLREFRCEADADNKGESLGYVVYLDPHGQVRGIE